MYRNRGNSKHGQRNVKRTRRQPSRSELAQYIAESIAAKEAHGVAWTMSEYTGDAELAAMVMERL